MIWKISAAACAIVALALALPAVRHLREIPPPAPPVIRAQLAVPEGVTLGSGADTLDAAIAPDEQRVAFVATRDGVSALWLQTLATGETRQVAGSEGATLPAWNRDGRRLAFFAQGKLNTLEIGSGVVTRLADAPTPRGAAWRDDGAVLFAGSSGGVIQLSIDGNLSPLTTLADGDAGHEYPFIDETGRLLYIAARRDGTRVVRFLPNGSGGPAEDLTQTSGHAELRAGVLIHVRDNVLLAQRLGENDTRLVGRSLALATGVGRSETGHAYFASSPRIALWAVPVPRSGTLTWVDAAGTTLSTAAEPGDYWQVRLSPNARDAAVTVLDPLLRTLDVMAIPLSSPGSARRVSLGIGPDTDPVWSPDGATLLYRSVQSGAGAILSRPSGRSSQAETTILKRPAVDVTPSEWRGDLVVAHTLAAGGRRVITSFNVRTRTGQPLTDAAFNSWDARISDDGRWIAYVGDESGSPEIYVQPWPGTGMRVRATFGGGQRPQWGPGGALYFRRGEQIARAMVSGSPAPVVSTPQTLFKVDGLRDFAVSPTGERFLIIGSTTPGIPGAAGVILDWAGAVPPPPEPPPKL